MRAAVPSCLISLPNVVELELNEDWFRHGDLGFSTLSSEDDFIRCDVGDEANSEFEVSNVKMEDSVMGISVLAATTEIGWWSSISFE